MLKGIAAVDGYGIGNIYKIEYTDPTFVPKTGCNPKKEWKRYKKAVEKFSADTKKSAQKVLSSIGKKEADILTSHIAMGEDLYLNNEAHRLINEGACAESALNDAYDVFIDLFASSDDEILRQRSADLKDIKNAILSNLLGLSKADLSAIKPQTVLVAESITPSVMARINKENIVGIITENGGKTSHAAIIASTLEIPTVLAAKNCTRALENGQEVIVDGFRGIIISQPESAQIEYYNRKKEEHLKLKKALSVYIDKPTVSADGRKYKLFANISTEQAVNLVIENGAEGIGLFRSEFLFLNRTSAPSEKEQFYAYKHVIAQMGKKPVTIRLLDISDDKNAPYLLAKNDEPILSLRGVRYLLKNKPVLRTQLRAILRASAFGNVRILIPFVTSAEEIIAVRKMIGEICAKFDAEAVKYKKDIKVGAMIETPAAALTVDLLAEQADFFSIGTNDLVQHTMAADRGEVAFADIYSEYSPAVIRSIKIICRSARRCSKKVCVCGEAAANLSLTPLFIAFGVNELSVAPRKIPPLRKNVSKYTAEEARNTAKAAMSLKDEKEVKKYLE